jgi:short-subunit dehydrogenase
MKNLNGRVAAITGASSGIGRALALELAARGCNLALASHSRLDALAETAALAAKHGVKVSYQQVDVARREQVEGWAERVVTEQGRINLIFNNAGVGLTGSVMGTSREDFEWVMGINFWGVVNGTQAFLPHLIAAGEGHVVNVSSMAGLIALPDMSAYNASKFAVRGYTETLRQELDMAGQGVSATCVLPGGVKTNIVAVGRVSGTAADAAGRDPEISRKSVEKMLRTSAEHAARAIVGGVCRNARRVLIGPDARSADLLQRLMPGLYQPVITTGVAWVNRQVAAQQGKGGSGAELPGSPS